mgnify:CR=1 FL=1
MARPYVFPDPDDRSKNEPCYIASSQQVLGLYNQDNEEGDEMQKVTKKVQDWFMDRAQKEGWDEFTFSGNQCILKNNF